MKYFYIFTNLVAGLFLIFSSANAKDSGHLRMDSVYQGPIIFPDFKYRDRRFSNYRTRITEEMKTGPNFAGHYAIVIIGCGTSCRFAFVADVATGKLFDFPYGGEENYSMNLKFNVKSNYVNVNWISGDNCISDFLTWNKSGFEKNGPRVIGGRDICEANF